MPDGIDHDHGGEEVDSWVTTAPFVEWGNVRKELAGT